MCIHNKKSKKFIYSATSKPYILKALRNWLDVASSARAQLVAELARTDVVGQLLPMFLRLKKLARRPRRLVRTRSASG